MPRAPAEEEPAAAELGAMPTTTTESAAASAPPAAGDAEPVRARLGAAAEVAKVQGRKLAEVAQEGAKKGLEIGKVYAEEATASVATAEKRAALVMDSRARAASYVVAGQQTVVRGHALYVTRSTPGVGQGAVAERLGIEYESAVEGELLPGYDAELVSSLRQFDQSTSVLRSLVQVTSATRASFEALAFSQTEVQASAAAEHARLVAVPEDHVSRSKPSASLRPSAENVAAEEARYTSLVGELGDAYGSLSAASTALVESAEPMRDRAAVIAEKVVADVLLTVASHGRWVQDRASFVAQVEALRTAGKDVTHAETRVSEVESKVAREREGVLLKVQLLEDKRREMTKRWLLDYMAMQSRFYSAGAVAFPSRPELEQAPGVAPSHAAAMAAGTAAPPEVAAGGGKRKVRLPSGYPSPADAATVEPAPAPAAAAAAVDYSQYYSSSAADLVKETETSPAAAVQEEEEEHEEPIAAPQRPDTPPRPDPPAVPAREQPPPHPSQQQEVTPAPDTTKGDALFADAEALAQRNEWDLCVHTVTRAMSVGCTDTAQAHFLHGIALGEIGLPVEAAAALQKCIELNPAHEHVAEELQLATEAAAATQPGETAI